MGAYLISHDGLVELDETPAEWRRLPRLSPKRWVKEQAKARPTGNQNKGKKYPATPPAREDILLILDEIFDPVRDTGKWAEKWGPIRLRNRALVVTLWRSGLRIHEALLLKPADIDFERGMVVVQKGKGGKRGISGIDPAGLAEINSWLFIRSLLGFGLDEYVFPVLEGPSRGSMLSQAYVRTKLHQAARNAGVVTRVAPHQFRHAMATEMARDGVPVPLISRQLRHTNIATTATYLAGIAPEEVLAVTGGRVW